MAQTNRIMNIQLPVWHGECGYFPEVSVEFERPAAWTVSDSDLLEILKDLALLHGTQALRDLRSFLRDNPPCFFPPDRAPLLCACLNDLREFAAARFGGKVSSGLLWQVRRARKEHRIAAKRACRGF